MAKAKGKPRDRDAEESAWVQGNRAAWVRMLQACLIQLGIEDLEAGKARWAMEREEAVAMLRQVCAEHGDNDWPDNGYLRDVIEKHLWRHLPDPGE